MESQFDVIIIGGGHAGCEAAHASARIGARTAMVTMNPERIGFMPCNPAIGGLAKGQLVKEVDALGGLMGRVADSSGIQFRRLNSSKGPAVRSSRAQCDKDLYSENMRARILATENLEVVEGEVVGISTEHGEISGVKVAGRRGDRFEISARSVVVTSGTFLRAVMHEGEKQEEGGRHGDRSARGLSQFLDDFGIRLKRLKTGTPPRLHADSIDYARTEPQPGDEVPRPFSFYSQDLSFPRLPQVNCFITHTNAQAHEIIEKNLERSPMFSGAIQGVGPRYCPSIEDKIHRFRDKERHQIFLEPEGLSTKSVYVNGISTSLPAEVQQNFVRSVEGLEKAEILKHGYAVEYDAVDARQLMATLESKDVPGLFLAGQVNGTSGYEEAAGQGLIAGINAANRAKDLGSFKLTRIDGYIGVLIDDLILRGSDEPYRMFTSRAEYRLLLREDNADKRLSERGFKLGLLSEADFAMASQKLDAIETLENRLRNEYLIHHDSKAEWFPKNGYYPLKDRASYADLLKRPEVDWDALGELGFTSDQPEQVKECAEINIRYEGYIKRDMELLEGVRKNESTRIPKDIDFEGIAGLSNEVRGILKETRPETIGQVARLQRVTPAAVANLMIHLKIREKQALGAQNQRF